MYMYVQESRKEERKKDKEEDTQNRHETVK